MCHISHFKTLNCKLYISVYVTDGEDTTENIVNIKKIIVYQILDFVNS